MMRGAGRRSDAIYTFTAHRRAWLYTQPLDGGHRWARRHSTLRAVLTDPRPSAQQRDKRSTWCAAKSAGVLDRRTGTVSPGENMGGTAHPSMSTSRRGPSVFFSSSQAALLASTVDLPLGGLGRGPPPLGLGVLGGQAFLVLTTVVVCSLRRNQHELWVRGRDKLKFTADMDKVEKDGYTQAHGYVLGQRRIRWVGCAVRVI
jgi:hypothetical protein